MSRNRNEKISENIMLEELWDYRNNDVSPSLISSGSGRVMRWNCSSGHHWEEQVNNLRLKKAVCPYCSLRFSIAGENDISTTYPEIAKIYSSTNKMHISEVTIKNCREFLAICSVGHIFKTTIIRELKVIQKGKKHCPYCQNRIILKGFNDMETVFDKNVLNEWHSDNPHPSEICIGSTIKYKWVCRDCGLERLVSPYSVKRGENKCCSKECYNNRNKISYLTKWIKKNGSLKSNFPDIAEKYIDSMNQYTSSTISPYSQLKAWWKCENGHIYENQIFNVVRGVQCSKCFKSQKRSKFENEVNVLLKDIGFDTIQSDRKIIKPYELDIWIKKYSIGIECNGDYWHSNKSLNCYGKDAYDYHSEKERRLSEANGELFFVWEWDWHNNRDKILYIFNELYLHKNPDTSLLKKKLSIMDSPHDYTIL